MSAVLIRRREDGRRPQAVDFGAHACREPMQILEALGAKICVEGVSDRVNQSIGVYMPICRAIRCRSGKFAACDLYTMLVMSEFF